MKPLIALAFAIALAGCAGTPFKWEEVRKIKSGMSIEEVTGLVGTPNSVSVHGDTIRYVWVYASAFQGGRSLIVEFKDGKVAKAPPIPDSF